MPIYAVLWFKLVTNIVLNIDLSQNAPIKCCFRNIKYFTKFVLRMLENSCNFRAPYF